MSRIYVLDAVPRKFVPRPRVEKEKPQHARTMKTDDKPDQTDQDNVIKLADALIEGFEAGDQGETPEAICQYCDNAIAKLRPIKRVGISKRIVALSIIKNRYAASIP
jgi:hypothetical protein